MSRSKRIFRAIFLAFIIYLWISSPVQANFSEPIYAKADNNTDIPYPGLRLEYHIFVTMREENSSVEVPIPANLTVMYHDYLNESVINSTLTLSSYLLSIYYRGTEYAEVWENVTDREVQKVILDQAPLLSIFYIQYQNVSATSYTPFWVFKKPWFIGERIGAYDYELEVKKITAVILETYKERSGVIAAVNRIIKVEDVPVVKDNATLVYDVETGLLIKGEILNWNAYYYNPPRYYTMRIELIRTTYPSLAETSGVTGTIPLPPLFSVSRTSAAYLLLSIFIPVIIAVINFSRIRRIQGGDR